MSSSGGIVRGDRGGVGRWERGTHRHEKNPGQVRELAKERGLGIHNRFCCTVRLACFTEQNRIG